MYFKRIEQELTLRDHSTSTRKRSSRKLIDSVVEMSTLWCNYTKRWNDFYRKMSGIQLGNSVHFYLNVKAVGWRGKAIFSSQNYSGHLGKYLCTSPKETNVKEISKNNAMYFSQRKGGLRILTLIATNFTRENLLIRINGRHFRQWLTKDIEVKFSYFFLIILT